MRAYIVVAMVCLVALPGLIQPWISLLGYIWFTLMRPDYFSWSMGYFPYSTLLEACTLLGVLRFAPKGFRVFAHPIPVIFIIFQIPLLLSAVQAVYPALSIPHYQDFARLSLMLLMIPILADSLSRMRQLIITITASLGIIALDYGAYGISYGGAYFHEGYGGIDNNGLALLMAMMIPLAWYLREILKHRLINLALLAVTGSAIIACVMTRSRGGTLALASILLLLVLRSKRRLVGFVLLALLSIFPIYLIREDFITRMSTLTKLEDDLSIQSRFIQFRTSLQVWKDHPIFGVGFGNENYLVVQDQYIDPALGIPRLKVHNSFLQILVDAGTPALLLYLLLFGVTITLLQRSIWRCRGRRDLMVYPLMLQPPLIGYLQFSLAGGQERNPMVYILVMSSAAWLMLEKKLLQEDAAAELHEQAYVTIEATPSLPPPPPEAALPGVGNTAPSGPRPRRGGLIRTNPESS